MKLVGHCYCPVCLFKIELERVHQVDTDAYHGTGALESLEFKLSYLIKAIEALSAALVCENAREMADGSSAWERGER